MNMKGYLNQARRIEWADKIKRGLESYSNPRSLFSPAFEAMERALACFGLFSLRFDPQALRLLITAAATATAISAASPAHGASSSTLLTDTMTPSQVPNTQ